MKCGGIHEALKINQICETAGIECMIGCMAEETTIGITVCPFSRRSKEYHTSRFRCDIRFRNCARNWGVSLEAKPLLELGEAAGLGISH